MQSGNIIIRHLSYMMCGFIIARIFLSSTAQSNIKAGYAQRIRLRLSKKPRGFFDMLRLSACGPRKVTHFRNKFLKALQSNNFYR